MGLLVTLYLIMVNTYSSALQQTPKERNYGFMELWLSICQGTVFLAMLEYAVILYFVKQEHTNECVVTIRKIGGAKKNKRTVCCKNRRFEVWDRCCLGILPTIFILFNIGFWLHVSSVTNDWIIA